MKRTLSTTCLAGKSKADIENHLFKRKGKTTRHISTKAENKHLSEKTAKEQMNGLTANSLEIKKTFLKPIKRILEYLPLKALGVTKTSSAVQAVLYDGLCEAGLRWHR